MAQKDIRVLMPSDIAAFRIVADCCNIDKKELLARSGMTKSRFKV